MGHTPPAELWNADRLAEYLGVGRRYIYKITQERRIAHLRVGGSLRFTPEAVAAFVENETVLDRTAPRPKIASSEPAARRPGRPRRTERGAA